MRSPSDQRADDRFAARTPPTLTRTTPRTHGNDGKTFPIVVLVSRGDRLGGRDCDQARCRITTVPWIVGQTTFGKGLVQTVYNLSENTGLALTTYHYYTPWGWLIQRNYAGVCSRLLLQPCRRAAFQLEQPGGEAHDSGSTVYGGGGITPDEKVDTPTSNHFQDDLMYKDVFFNFAPLYVSNHTVDKNFQVDDAVTGEFKKFLTSQSIALDRGRPGRRQRLAEGAASRSKIFTIQFGQLQGLRTLADWDPEIAEGADVFARGAGS